MRRPITRADAVALFGALLLLVAMFLPIAEALGFSAGRVVTTTYTAWHRFGTAFILGVWLPGLAVAASLIAEFLRGDLPRLGTWTWAQLRAAAAVSAAWLAIWALVSGYSDAWGGWVSVVGTLLLVVGTAAAEYIPGFTSPLTRATPAANGAAAGSGGVSAAAPQPGPVVEPFWFAVPAPTPVFDPAAPHMRLPAPLQPGIWYLATGALGDSLAVRLDDHRTAVLHDTGGIQRS